MNNLLEDAVLPEEIEREYKRAKSKALDLLAGRAYTKKRLRDKLVEREFSADTAEAAVLRMEELGLVDDRAYGEQFFAYLTETKRFGAYRVRQEMKNRGVPEEVTGELLSDAEVDWIGNAVYWIRRKYAGVLEDEKVRRRAYGGLVRQGFSGREIREALKLFELEESEEQVF